MEALCAVMFHVNTIGRVSLQQKTVVEYSVATEVLKANTTTCVVTCSIVQYLTGLM